MDLATMISTGGVSLGEDLETEILVRLPAKSLLRFKCVKRSWNALFKTPDFVIRNMNINMSKNNNDRHHFVIIDQYIKRICPTHNHCTDALCTYALDGNEKHTYLQTNLMLLSLPDKAIPTPYIDKSFFSNNTIGMIKLYGHCNGVLCLESCKDDCNLCLILWNPTTREVHHVPPPSSSIHPEYLIGFGAAPNTNDFKVVKLNVNHANKSVFSLSSIEIYNLNKKSWTTIHNPILPPTSATTRYYNKRPNRDNIFVNGIYYWNTGYTVEGFAIIFCFDFNSNKFHSLMGPVSRMVREVGLENLAEINGFLAYVVELSDMSKFVFWIMDKHGWAKIYNLVKLEPTIQEHVIFKGKNDFQFIGGMDGQLLTLYDYHDNSLQKCQIILRQLVDVFLVHEYVQSIVPLST